MTHDINALPPTTLADARAAGWQVAQLNLSGSNPEEGYRQAGLPKNKRVLVVIGYQGCSTHDFLKLENEARTQGADLVVINGNTTEAGSEKQNYTPQINVRITTPEGKPTHRPLNGLIVTPKNADGTLMSPAQISELGNKLGMPIARGTNSSDPVSSTGAKLFENGKPLEYYRKVGMPERAGAFALG
ncbi:MAG: hypothetical protein V4735_06285 [Pseudomonadota bacterium]